MRYFKELDSLNKTYIVESIVERREKKEITFFDFYNKHSSVFVRIDQLNRHLELTGIFERLKELSRLKSKLKNTDEEYKLMQELHSQIRGLALFLLYSNGVIDERIERHFLYELIEFYGSFDENSRFLDARLLFYNKEEWSFYELRDILEFYHDFLEVVNVTHDNLLADIKSAIDDLPLLKKVEEVKHYECHSLPDEWFIVPSFNDLGATVYNKACFRGKTDYNLLRLWPNIMGGCHLSNKSSEVVLNDVKEIQNEEFASYFSYIYFVRWGLGQYGRPYILDPRGEPYGLRKNLQEAQKSEVFNILLGLRSIVPKEKVCEFERFVKEKRDSFNILDSRGLASSYREILDKLMDYAKDSFSSHFPSKETLKVLARYKPEIATMTPESYYATQFHMGLLVTEEALRDASLIDIDKNRLLPTYIYNPVAKTLLASVFVVYGVVTKYFANLQEKAMDYRQCLDYLNTMDMDDVLVRCCGFHKIVRRYKNGKCYNVIITSDPNYEEEFKEYINRGWIIDFLPPIILNEDGVLIDTTGQHRTKRLNDEKH